MPVRKGVLESGERSLESKAGWGLWVSLDRRGILHGGYGVFGGLHDIRISFYSITHTMTPSMRASSLQ
jgi:hypothetical protein